MLNITDIQEYYTKFPEPPEIQEIRDKIISSFKKLQFEAGPHKYFVKEGEKKPKKIELRSVSKLVSSFEPYTDWDTIRQNYAIKNNMTVDQVKRMWREKNIKSTNNGTSTHLFGESYFWFFLNRPENIDPVVAPQYEEGFLIPYSPKQEAVAMYFEGIMNYNKDPNNKVKLYPVLPETMMYILPNNEYGIEGDDRFAGTMDILLAYKDPEDGIFKLVCDDWKTNISLFDDFKRKNGKYLEHPFDDVIDENYGHYSIQLSAYTLMLRQLGFIVTERNIVWLSDNGTYQRIKVNDYSDRLIKRFGKKK